FTSDLNTALVMSERLEAGMVAINDWMPVTAEAPFGGVKGSGFGRETGQEGLHEYLDQKSVFIGGVQISAGGRPRPRPASPAARWARAGRGRARPAAGAAPRGPRPPPRPMPRPATRRHPPADA